jgi:undecaprenyl-diphosphatase
MKKEKIKSTIKENWLWCMILIIVLVLFFKIAEDVFEKEIFNFDFTIYNFILIHRNNLFNNFFKIFTYLGSAYVIITTAILIAIVAKDKNTKIIVPTNVAIVALLNVILKNIFARPRPNNLRLIQENGYSFPSGHAMISTAFYGLLIYIICTKVKTKKEKVIYSILLSLLIVLIDFSRIYLGVHYVSDVLAGSCLSIAYVIIFVNTNKLIKMKISKGKEKVK